MDDLIDEDTVRDYKSAFWTVHGQEATIEQAAYHLAQARMIAGQLGIATFEQRVCEVIAAARLEVEMENPDYKSELSLPQLWAKVVEKEASFRLLLAEALNCPADVYEAAYQDGVAAQMLDDGLSAIYGKDGRPDNSDERLGRLTYMRAYGVSRKKRCRKEERSRRRLRQCLGGNKMSFNDLAGAKASAIVNGEHLLLGGTPPEWQGKKVCPAAFYKRRYTWDGDLTMGCTIGCDFCYYRWINNSVDTIGKGKKGLRQIATPQQAVQFLGAIHDCSKPSATS